MNFSKYIYLPSVCTCMQYSEHPLLIYWLLHIDVKVLLRTSFTYLLAITH